MGELLPQGKFYDKNTTLLWGDLKRLDNSWLLHIKSPKSRTKGGEFVDIFEFKGQFCCPVKALDELKRISVNSNNMTKAVFIFNNGKPLTKNVFNKTISELLRNEVKNSNGSIKGHSFRAGIPSLLAKYPNLSKANLIKGWGRWSSEAYQLYTRLKQNQKCEMFKIICEILNKDTI